MESVDLDNWFTFTKRRLGDNCRIYLVARGAGATACLLAAQQKGFDECVCGIIADSPMASLSGFLRATLPQSTKLNPDWIIGQIRREAQHKFGFDINRCDCAVHASSIKVPVLIFQGGEDDITVPSYSRDLYDNLRCRKRMVIVRTRIERVYECCRVNRQWLCIILCDKIITVIRIRITSANVS